MKLANKVALVTGAGRVGSAGRPRGIGPEIARHLAILGADIVLNDYTGSFDNAPSYDLSKKEELEAAADEIRALGRRAIAVNADVSDSEAVEGIIERALSEFGRIDILVNNAGVNVGRKSIVDLDEELWDLSMNVMAKGAFLCSRAVAKVLIRQGDGGSIVNISSIMGKIGAPFVAPYVAAKHAILGLTKALSAELISYGINVNAVCPGYTETHMIYLQDGPLDLKSKPVGTTLEELKKEICMKTPAGRLATVGEIASVVAGFCLPEFKYVNGQALVVDGGGVTI